MFGTGLCYVALRLVGESGDGGDMMKARSWILMRGGITSIPSWGKLWLSLLGVYHWNGNNPLPPEMWLLPYSFNPFHPGTLFLGLPQFIIFIYELYMIYYIILQLQGECGVTAEWYIWGCHTCMAQDLWVPLHPLFYPLGRSFILLPITAFTGTPLTTYAIRSYIHAVPSIHENIYIVN